MKLSMLVLLTVLGGSAAATLSGCEKKGPAEKAGEKVDDALEEAGDKIEDAGDKVEDALDKK